MLVIFGTLALTFPEMARSSGKVPVVGVLWHAANATEEAAFRNPLREGFEKLGKH
jgi:hypothetical protein